MRQIGSQGLGAAAVVRAGKAAGTLPDGGDHPAVGSRGLPDHAIAAHRVADVLPGQAMPDPPLLILHRQVRPVADNDQARLGLVDLSLGQGFQGPLIQTLAALILDLVDARLLTLREPADRHQGANL